MTSRQTLGDRRPGGHPATFEDIESLHAVLGPVMRAIATAAGPTCEVVLHDLSRRDLQHTIYAIENGHVTGRSVGGPSTSLGLEVRQNEAADHDKFGYGGRTSDGRELHCSSTYYRNAIGHVIAAFCINIDLTGVQHAQAAIAALLPAPPQAPSGDEIIAPDIRTVLDSMLDDAVQSVGKPTALMDKNDRVTVFRLLEQRGAFHIKRAVDQTARRLGISKVTAYGYLEQVRNP